MAETWLSYSEIGAALGIGQEAARGRARRERWRRQLGNDGKARVLVDLDALKARTVRPDGRQDGRQDVQQDIRQDIRQDVQPDVAASTIAALEAHIATLKDFLAAAKAEAEARAIADRADYEAERARADRAMAEIEVARGQADGLVAELAALARLMAERRPWWRRWRRAGAVSR